MAKLPISLLLISLLPISHLWACSAFVLQNQEARIIGKNFDWIDGSDYLLINPRNETKYALPTQSDKNPLTWLSLYGSVTFNQHGKNQPYGGMNEKGLIVEMLWLEQTAYPTSVNAAQYLNELELIQLLLDRCQNVAEVELQMAVLNIFPLKGKIHYLISDAEGNSALVDFLNGRVYWQKSTAGQCVAITNNADYYARAYYQRNPKTKKMRTRQSLPRFVLLNNEIKSWQKNGEKSAEKQGKTMLKKAELAYGKFRTRWSAIYDGKANTLQFRHDEGKIWHKIILAELDFTGKLLAVGLGSRSLQFSDYFPELNQIQISFSFAGIGLNKLNASEITRHQFGEKISTDNSYTRNYALLEIPLQLDDSLMRVLRFRLYDQAGFTTRKTVPMGDVRMRYSGKTAVWQFPGMPKGDYGLLVYQDIDQNKKLNDEPHAFSGNAWLNSGLWPEFHKIRLELNRDFVQYPLHIRR